ncbi:MAG TPA: NAD(P)-binding domain-containing protein, partial [Pyrinomonadaceae bacterium]|nr:NAD(P)-binding domain-containing protein [Pyrinomonadaceae bacterium]
MRLNEAQGGRRKTKAQRTREEGGPSLSTAPTVAVVGAGRLGTALALALASCGYVVVAVVARRAARARRAASLISARTLALPASQLSKLPPARLLLVTTPDDHIPAAAARLASHVTAEPSSVALHGSGALSSDVLAPLRARGF